MLRDRWGINHIYAKSEADLFFAQGYAAARDRLFQFELWRRQATGTVAEILGRKELKRDIGTRLHMFRGDLKAELNWYHPRGEAIITAYVRGINAYIAEALQQPRRRCRSSSRCSASRPAPWTPEVVISRHNGLLANIGAGAEHGAGGARPRRREGEGPAVLPGRRSRHHARSGDRPVAAQLVDPRALQRVPPADRRSAPRRPQPQEPSALELSQRVEDIGSNNWVVSGKLTQSGYPLMMNDPHRNQGAPSLRYWVHLVAPGWNVIGGGEPMLPGVSIGHNEYGAWGLTIFGSDSEDLYVYETNPANPNQYKYRGAWEDMRDRQGHDQGQGRGGAGRTSS